MNTRIEIAPDRFAGWVTRFVATHPGASVQPDGPDTVLSWPDESGRPHQVTCQPFPADPVLIVLVRRAGYAVGLAQAGRLVAKKVGSRHIHGRTAAGGWSQQRYARRRANQAQELAAAVAAHAASMLAAAPGQPVAGLLVGGDKAMVAAVLAEPSLTAAARLPRRELYDLPTPDAAVLKRAIARGLAVWCTGATGALTAPTVAPEGRPR